MSSDGHEQESCVPKRWGEESERKKESAIRLQLETRARRRTSFAKEKRAERDNVIKRARVELRDPKLVGKIDLGRKVKKRPRLHLLPQLRKEEAVPVRRNQ